MARTARIVVPGYPHHVTQRGNRRQRTFFGNADYRAYIALMAEWCRRDAIAVWAYCLMPNHAHLVVVPADEDGLRLGIGEAHRRYTRRINFRKGWRGHLWQGRFSSYVMDEPYLIAAARYIERNPVKAHMVEHAADWPWSSARAHCEGRGDALAEGDWLAERIAGWICSWAEYLEDLDDEGLVVRIRKLENTGRPLGDRAFIERLGSLLGRDLVPKKPGPPRRTGS